jgi:antibiotic biosynthesis monooxygenase (ABM) superfamily enzyme
MGSQAQDQGIQHHERREDFWKQSSEEEEACESRSCMSSYFLVQTHHHPILSIARSTSCTWKRLCTFMTFYICSSLQKTSCLPPIVSFLLFQSPCCMCLLVGFFFVSCLSTLVDSQ